MLEGRTSLRGRVADHYRGQGYRVREQIRVKGRSGQVHTVEMAVEGSLGTLVVGFEDDGGFEGPEMGYVRHMAEDLGATPVFAASQITPGARAMAARLGVVLLDGRDLHHEDPGRDPGRAGSEEDMVPWPKPRGGREPDPVHHPWPASGRLPTPSGPERAEAVDVEQLLAAWSDGPGPEPEPATGIWKHGRDPDVPRVPNPRRDEDRPGSGFAWLTGRQDPPGPSIETVRAPLRSYIPGAALRMERVAEAPPGPVGAGGASDAAAALRTRDPVPVEQDASTVATPPATRQGEGLHIDRRLVVLAVLYGATTALLLFLILALFFL